MENALQLQVIAESLHSRLQRDAILVPTLPPLTERVVRLLQTPGVDTESLIALFPDEEQATTRVLRTASSPLFNRGGGLLTLPQAIHQLGLQTIGDFTLAATLTADLFYAPGYHHCILEQLQGSILCAIWSREIAKLRRRGLDAAFRTGLLWDIGRPLVIQEALDSAIRHRMHLSYDYVLTLADQFGPLLTQRILQHWQMPLVVGDVAGSFASYSGTNVARDQTMVTVAGARLAAYCSHGKNRAACRNKILVDPIFAELRLPAKALVGLLERADLVSQAAEHLLGL